jgi:hypothetical protein
VLILCAVCACLCVCVQCIVLLEDVDVAFPDRGVLDMDIGGKMAGKGLSGPMASYGGSGSEVTFSGLLNILDGAVSRCVRCCTTSW